MSLRMVGEYSCQQLHVPRNESCLNDYHQSTDKNWQVICRSQALYGTQKASKAQLSVAMTFINPQKEIGRDKNLTCNLCPIQVPQW